MTIYSTMTRTDEVRWFGNSDSATKAATFFTDGQGGAEFETVVRALVRLANEVKDGNGDEPVQLIAIRRSPRVSFVAYRFTSDWASRRYYLEVLKSGLGLGRGCFEPFTQGSLDYEHYLR